MTIVVVLPMKAIAVSRFSIRMARSQLTKKIRLVKAFR